MSETCEIKLSIRELCVGYPVNLRYVNRFSTSRCLRPENVAEHSFFVVFYALAIADWFVETQLLGRDQALSLLESTLRKATLHDLEECRTGDIHRPFKYSTASLKQSLDDAAEIASHQIVKRIWPDSMMAVSWQMQWSDSKDNSLAGRIVRFADYLSVLSFVMQEGPGASERLCLDSMMEHFLQFDQSKEFDFIRPLVSQAAELTAELFPSLRGTIMANAMAREHGV